MLLFLNSIKSKLGKSLQAVDESEKRVKEDTLLRSSYEKKSLRKRQVNYERIFVVFKFINLNIYFFRIKIASKIQ